MGGKCSAKPDHSLKDFWRDPERFADLFNTRFFEGKPVIVPDQLADLDTDLSSVVWSKNAVASLDRHRDVCKEYHGMELRVIFGIENQNSVHYAMPLRNRIYDDLVYEQQVRRLAKENRKSREARTPAVFLSGLKKSDRLKPCLTVTIYYGEQEWDGPVKLSDMVDVPGEIKPFFQDYTMCFVSAREEDGAAYKNTDVQDLFSVLFYLYHGNTEKLLREDKVVDIETYHVLQSLPVMKNCLADLKPDVNGGVHMCTALRQLRQDGISQGVVQGKILAYAELGVSKEEIATKLNISLDRVERILNENVAAENGDHLNLSND